MYIAYYRVSTQRQGQSGLGLDAQRDAVRRFAGSISLDGEFTEIESGRKSDRPELIKAIATAKAKKATLVIAKLDRLARNVHFISGLLESGVSFVAADMPEADRTFLQMAAVFAEWEARKISERTIAALQAAKARGQVLGSPNIGLAIEAATARRKVMYDAYLKRWGKKLTGLAFAGTLAQCADDLMANGVPTPTGKTKWTPQQVKQVRAKCLN